MHPSSRTATLNDVPNIVDVILAAMPHTPQWDYRFPYRRAFPEDHHKYTRLLHEQFVKPTNEDWLVQVIEITASEETDLNGAAAQQRGETSPDGNIVRDETPGNIAAVAVWDVSYINKREHGSSYVPFSPPAYVAKHGGSTRRDVNPAHQKAFLEIGEQARKMLAVYGDDQLGLQILATHPDHWRHGYATILCEWGKRLASAEGLVVSLIASSNAVSLYEKLKFKNLGVVKAGVQGEEESLESTVLVYDPKDQVPITQGNL